MDRRQPARRAGHQLRQAGGAVREVPAPRRVHRRQGRPRKDQIRGLPRQRPAPFPIASGERTIQDIGGIELLLDQAVAEIEIDGLLLVGDDAVIDRRDADLGAAAASSAAPPSGCSSACPRSRHSSDIVQRPRARRGQPAQEVFQLRPLVADRIRRCDLKADARRQAFRRDDASRLEQHLLLADIGLPGRPRVDRALAYRRPWRPTAPGTRCCTSLGRDQPFVSSAARIKLMPDRTAAGRDLLALQIVEALDLRILRAPESRGLPASAGSRAIAFTGTLAAAAKVNGASPTSPVSIAPAPSASSKRRSGRKFLPLDLVGHVLEHAGRFHHGLRIALLVADAQRALRIGRDDRTPAGSPQQ